MANYSTENVDVSAESDDVISLENVVLVSFCSLGADLKVYIIARAIAQAAPRMRMVTHFYLLVYSAHEESSEHKTLPSVGHQ